MTVSDLDKLRPGQPDCPSDLMLDRLAAGELPADGQAWAQAHVDSCQECGGRMLERRFEGLPGADPRVMLAVIRRGLDEPRGLRDRALAFWRRLQGARGALVAVAGLAAVLIAVRLAPSHGLAGGDPGLHLPAEGHVSILGVHKDGRLYTVWQPGPETLYLIHCPLRAGPPACQSRGADAPPACQPGCVVTRFVASEAR